MNMNRFQLALPKVRWRNCNSLYETQRNNTDRHHSPFEMRCASGVPIGMQIPIDDGTKKIRFWLQYLMSLKAEIRYSIQKMRKIPNGNEFVNFICFLFTLSSGFWWQRLSQLKSEWYCGCVNEIYSGDGRMDVWTEKLTAEIYHASWYRIGRYPNNTQWQ